MVDVFDLKFLTFDIYPVINNKPGFDPEWIIKNYYYNFMDLYGRYCRDKKIPIWLVMLCVEHQSHYPNGSLEWKYPEITEGLLKLQAMNGLAFGMKGLAYWRYGSKEEKVGSLSYKDALYDINKMEKAPAWDAARKVNDEAAQYGVCLQNAIYDESCLAAKDSVLSGTLPTDTIPPFHDFNKFKGSFECVKSISYSGVGVLLSHLTQDDVNYLAVVNQDYANNQKIILVFDKTERVKRIKIAYPVAINGIGTPEEFVPYTTTINLMPGEMALFKY